MRGRLNNPHSPDSLQSISQKKTCRVDLQPAGLADNCHGAHPEERARLRPDPLRRLGVRRSSCAYGELGGPDGCPSRHPMGQGSPSRIRGEGLSPRNGGGLHTQSVRPPAIQPACRTSNGARHDQHARVSGVFGGFQTARPAVDGAERRGRSPQAGVATLQ